jgi:hypothetical protein
MVLISSSFVSVVSIAPLAYLDPGTGSLVLQMLLAGALGGLYVARQWWSRLITVVSRTSRR